MRNWFPNPQPCPKLVENPSSRPQSNSFIACHIHWYNRLPASASKEFLMNLRGLKKGFIPLCLALLLASARAERLPIKTYTAADGLPRDHINRIVQDSKGFLWSCTTEGLSRFDGYGFVNYGTDQGLP